MNSEAFQWVRKLRLKNPVAKHILSLMAADSDKHGRGWIDVTGLAEGTELTRLVVLAELDWLNNIGAIYKGRNELFKLMFDDVESIELLAKRRRLNTPDKPEIRLTVVPECGKGE